MFNNKFWNDDNVYNIKSCINYSKALHVYGQVNNIHYVNLSSTSILALIGSVSIKLLLTKSLQ